MDDDKTHILYFLSGVITTLLFCLFYTLKKHCCDSKKTLISTFPKSDDNVPYDDL